MSNDNSTAATTNSTVAAETANAATTSENKNSQQDLIKNLKGEFNRKFSQMSEKLDAFMNAQTTHKSVEETISVEPDVKQYVDSVVNQQKQKDAWQEALTMFPELNPESEDFDEKFYKIVDAEFSTNQRKDPRGPLKAAKLAALELGKIEQLTKQNLLKDEARRSRILSEGSSSPREGKKDKDPGQSFNSANLAKLGIKDTARLAKRIKDNKEKYE